MELHLLIDGTDILGVKIIALNIKVNKFVFLSTFFTFWPNAPQF